MEPILKKVYNASLKFLAPLTPEETYALIVKEALKLARADYGSVILYQDQANQLEIVFTTLPLPPGIKPQPKVLPYEVFKRRKAMIIDVETDQKLHPTIRKMGIKSILMIPLSYRGKPFGVLSIDSRERKHFSVAELNGMKLLGALASLAIRKTQLYDQSKKALEARDLFISMAAHELRTPLTTISGYTQLLLSKFTGSNGPESRWIQDLSWETLRLTKLVNELLEVERIKLGQLKYVWKECSLRMIINRALTDFKFTHPNHQIKFEDKLGETSDKVVGDFDKLMQAILNILDNAAKFSPEGSEVALILERSGLNLNLTIKDQGAGIPKKDLPQIYNRFYQGTNHTREGMGIGLFLVKDIIKQHHGAINVRSQKGKGTTVEFKFHDSSL